MKRRFMDFGTFVFLAIFIVPAIALATGEWGPQETGLPLGGGTMTGTIITTADPAMYDSAGPMCFDNAACAATGHSLATGDVQFGGKTEFDGACYMDSTVEIVGPLTLGSGSIEWDNASGSFEFNDGILLDADEGIQGTGQGLNLGTVGTGTYSTGSNDVYMSGVLENAGDGFYVTNALGQFSGKFFGDPLGTQSITDVYFATTAGKAIIGTGLGTAFVVIGRSSDTSATGPGTCISDAADGTCPATSHSFVAGGGIIVEEGIENDGPTYLDSTLDVAGATTFASYHHYFCQFAQYDNNATMTLDADTFSDIDGFSDFITGSPTQNGCTVTNDKRLTVTNAGTYKVDYSVSFAYAGTGTNVYETSIAVNGTMYNACHRSRSASINTIGNVAGSCIVNLSASDQISVVIKNETDGDDVVIEDAGIVITQQ